MSNETMRFDNSVIYDLVYTICKSATAADNSNATAYQDALDLLACAGGTEYLCCREGKTMGQFFGTPAENIYTGERMIVFAPGLNIKQGDWLLNLAGESVYVLDTRTAFQGRAPTKTRAIVKTEAEVLHICQRSVANALLKRLIAHDVNNEFSFIVSVLGKKLRALLLSQVLG